MPKTSTNTVILAICAMAWLLLVVRMATNTELPPPRPMTAAQEEVQRFAKEQLNNLQARSFRENRELCGVIVEDETGRLDVLEIAEGDEASCQYSYPMVPGLAPVASFHTHGTHSDQYDGEVPSMLDLRTDIDARLDGYIATPGGRMWRIDWRNETAEMICGEGCLERDPNYVPCPGMAPETRYSRATLGERLNSFAVRC